MNVCFSVLLFSQDLELSEIADDSLLRKALYQEWILESPSLVLLRKPQVYRLLSGDLVQVRSRREGTFLLILFSRPRGTTYPEWTQGSWIVYRSLQNGKVQAIRFYPRSDPQIYLDFRAASYGTNTVVDFVIYGAYRWYARPTGLPWDSFFMFPLSTIVSNPGVDTLSSFVSIVPAMYQAQRILIEQIRKELPTLRYADDGAFDDEGRPVFINTGQSQGETWGLNCSGFAKWVVDGLLHARGWKSLTIESLKKTSYSRGSSFTEPYETTLDPFFGLDWTRNLAIAAQKVLQQNQKVTLETVEVQKNSLAGLIHPQGLPGEHRPYPGYLKNVGFPIEGLKALLYILAVEEPTYFYLGAISTVQQGKPPLRRYYHVAVFIPFFTEEGTFSVALFESAAETSFTDFVNRYRGQQINLVRVPLGS
ncbi:MAG: hypothetical protein N2Z76_05705 [Treponemataceae bacterium]|nr:hypothetical protein [Treponemataceae bacterium]